MCWYFRLKLFNSEVTTVLILFTLKPLSCTFMIFKYLVDTFNLGTTDFHQLMVQCYNVYQIKAVLLCRSERTVLVLFPTQDLYNSNCHLLSWKISRTTKFRVPWRLEFSKKRCVNKKKRGGNTQQEFKHNSQMQKYMIKINAKSFM